MSSYMTVLGDTFDSIAKRELGDRKYTQQLMNVNKKHIATVIFSAGIELILPEIDEDTSSNNDNFPPWRRD